MTTQTEQVQATKRCGKCHADKIFAEFSKTKRNHDGHQRYCKACCKQYKRDNWEKLAAYQKKFYSENAQELSIKNRLRAIEYRRKVNLDPEKKARLAEQRRISARNHVIKFPAKIAARKAVMKAINSGVIVRPDACSECGKLGKIEAHHDSYAPEHRLNVRWFCRQCHATHHRKYPDQPV